MKSIFIQMVIQHMRNRRYAKRTIELYCRWIVSYIRFNKNTHPAEMGDKDAELAWQRTIAFFNQYLG